MKKIFKKITAVLFAVFMLTTAIPAQAEELSSVTLPSGITAEEFKNELESLSRKLNEGEPAFASAAVGVFTDEEVIYTGYFGRIDIKNNISADENAVYEWGSITKTLVWVSAIQLWEQGRLDLERDVREYLPDGFFRHLSYDEPITMLNLMNHNAGWQETARPIWKTDENAVLSLGEELQAIEPAQIHRPGEVAAYSNYGAAVAGYVIECITGQDFCEYVRENIFEPLGMERTALNPTHSDSAWVYEQRKKTKSYQFSMENCIDLGNRLDYIPAYPAGAATGTLGDLITYAQALISDDAPLFKSKETQDFMFTGTDFYGDSDIPLCAHGFWCNENAVRTYGHNGATNAGQANMMFDPESKTGLVVMVNEPGGNDFLYYTPTLAFGTLSPEKYASGTYQKADLSGYFLSARSTYRGMLKFIPYLSAMSANSLGEAYDLGSDVYMIEYAGEKMLAGSKIYPDGSSGVQMTSMDMINDSFYLIELCLFTLYLLMAAAAVYLLLIRLKLKKHNRQTAYDGAAIMTAGQIARIVSVLALISTYVVFQTNQAGIPFAAGAVLGIVQMLCVAVCAVSAAGSVFFMVSKKQEKAFNIRYILNTVGCVLPITAIIYFEMYVFWNI